jgi:RNA polymerase sigma factor (sigma-70 family)
MHGVDAQVVNSPLGFGHRQAGRCYALSGGALTSGQRDAQLIACSRSDPAAFAAIFDRHHSELYRYLRRRVDGALAADLAAETFVIAFARRGAYSADTQDARPWLYGIAHNLLRNHVRAERRQLAAYARHGADPLADADAAVAFSLADSRADSAAGSAQLAGILAAMPGRDRDVLLLFAWAEMSYVEIGQALNIPVGTVRSRLNRARRQLRGLITSQTLNYTETQAWTN